MFPAQHFKRKEFSCLCGCGKDTIDAELLFVLELTREHFSKPLHVHSASRCTKHNKSIGGKPGSQHLLSKAADFHVDNVRHSLVYAFLNKMFPDTYGIALYEWGIHLDVRAEKARW